MKNKYTKVMKTYKLGGDSLSKLYAQKLRLGEERRDASDKIRGFLYQDLIAIQLIFTFDESYDCYVEWVEDIFLENENEIILIQVKHYPYSTVKFREIFKDMYYQFLKFKLLDSEKEMKTYCYHHSNSIYKTSIKSENLDELIFIDDDVVVDKKLLYKKLGECSNQEERKKLIFENFGSEKILNEISFECLKTKSIFEIKDEIGEILFKLLQSNEIVQSLPRNEAKNLLESLAIEYVQKNYYSKLELCSERKLTKIKFLKELSQALSYDDIKGISLVKSVFYNYVDEIFSDICEYTNDSNKSIVIAYEQIYRATKIYFDIALESKKSRYKFINTVSINQKYRELNFKRYQDLTLKEERELYLKNGDKIEIYIRHFWKLIYNLEPNFQNLDISKYIVEKEDCYLFTCSNDKDSPILLSSELSRSNETTQISKVISRVTKMEFKPSKWYLSTDKKYSNCSLSYPYSIAKIDNLDRENTYKLDDIDNSLFSIECMRCVKCDIAALDMERKDDLNKSLFCKRCVEEVK